MDRGTAVRALPSYRLEIEFADGVRGVLDYEDRLFGPMMEPLRDPARFAEVGIDEFGVICWPNGADLAPDAIYDRLKSGAAGAR
ncbi:MAG: hypothetical protein QG573_240 [Acidobacteriota bacterium]|nr:hypothetical protein [Acidobacteriota bacterium]